MTNIHLIYEITIMINGFSNKRSLSLTCTYITIQPFDESSLQNMLCDNSFIIILGQLEEKVFLPF